MQVLTSCISSKKKVATDPADIDISYIHFPDLPDVDGVYYDTRDKHVHMTKSRWVSIVMYMAQNEECVQALYAAGVYLFFPKIPEVNPLYMVSSNRVIMTKAEWDRIVYYMTRTEESVRQLYVQHPP